MSGREALRDGVAVIDLSARGRIRATGEDRKRLLHAMTTNHVQDLEPGQGVYAFFLTAQGKILADALILCREDHLLIDLEPETREKIFEHLDKFIIADDVTLEDVTGATCEIAVEGPKSAEWLASKCAPVPQQEYESAAWGEVLVVKASVTGQPGYRVIAPAGERDRLLEGAVVSTPEDVEVVRLENGRPRFGVDFAETNIAHETGLMHALHFNKGCYLGQEIVERVRSRGLVQRVLTSLRIRGDAVPAAGEKVMAGDAEAGKITSAAYSDREGAVRALAFVRLQHVQADAALTVGGAEAQIVQYG